VDESNGGTDATGVTPPPGSPGEPNGGAAAAGGAPPVVGAPAGGTVAEGATPPPAVCPEPAAEGKDGHGAGSSAVADRPPRVVHTLD
jgi:hypothetical protein